MELIKKEHYKSISWLVKIFFITLLLILAFNKLSDRQYLLLQSKELLMNSLGSVSALLWLIPVLLIPVNWGVESKKWQLLSFKLVSMSFWDAYIGVITGLSMSFVTPHSFGDYAGRIWQINHKDRDQLLSSIMLGRLAQMLATLVFGTFGLYVFISQKMKVAQLDKGDLWLLILLLVSFLSIVFFLFKRHWIMRVAHRFERYLILLANYTYKEIVEVVLLSFLRYLVFSAQFILILFLFDVDLPIISLCAGVTFILLVKSIVPSFNFLTDLGVRSMSALMFFELLIPADIDRVLVSSFVVWLINILFPSFVGMFFLIRMKLVLTK